MIRGLRTVIYPVANLDRAKAWYAGILGFGPYFDEPFYAGFGVGGFDLGLQAVEPQGTRSEGGIVAYWRVEDTYAALGRLLELGATEDGGVQDVGGGIRTATVRDPDGNAFGIIENPHFSLQGTS